jgi:AhpD family alkylhydroperoxidase
MKGFTVHTVDSAPQASKATLEQVKKGWGFVPTLQGTLAESPVTLEAHEALFALAHRTSFSPPEQQAALLAISVRHECEYCAMGHTFLGRKAGLDEASLEALRERRPLPGPRLEALRAFVEAVIDERGFVDDVRVSAFLAAGFTRAQVLEVLVLVSLKTISNYADHLTDLPKEPFMSDPALMWVAPRRRAGKVA